MAMRQWWGTTLLGSVLVTCLAVEAHSQQVGGTDPNAGFNPAAINGSPTAFSFGNDPFAGAGFDQCMRSSAMIAQASNVPDMSVLSMDPYSALTTVGVGAATGAVVGGVTSNSWNGALGGSMGPLMGVNNNCGGSLPENAGKGARNSCDDFKVGGSFNAAMLDREMAQANQQAQQAGCIAANAARAEMVTDCYEREITSLSEAMQAVKQDFDTNVRNMQGYADQVQAEIEKTTRNSETLQEKISTINNTISEVTRQLQKFDAPTNNQGGGGGLAGLQNQIQDHERQIRQFELNKKAVRANRVMGCFRNEGAASSGIRNCPSASGELMSPRACILSIYQDAIKLSLSGGSRSIKPGDLDKSRNAVRRFEERMNQMLGELGGQNPRVLSGAAFETRFGAELRQFGVAGQQVIQEVKNCDTQVSGEIDRELENSETELGRTAESLRATSRTVSSTISASVNELDGTIRNAGRELFGQELNELVNGAGCTQSTVTDNNGNVRMQPTALRTQLNCVQGLVANLRSMLNGTPPPGARAPLEIPLNVPGSDGQPVRCRGLRDCANRAGQMKAQLDSRKAAMEGNGTFQDPRCPGGCPGKKKFFKEANRNIQTAMQQAAQQFKRRSDIAKAQFQQLRTLFGGLDVQFSSPSPRRVSLDTACRVNEDALCQVPENMGDLLAGLSGAPNIKPEDMQGLRAKVTEKKTKSLSTQTALREQVRSLTALRSKCQNDARTAGTASRVQRMRNEFNEELESCRTAVETNRTAAQDFGTRVTELNRDLNRVCESMPADNTDCASLRSEMTRGRRQCEQVASESDRRRQTEYDTCVARVDVLRAAPNASANQSNIASRQAECDARFGNANSRAAH